MCSRPHLTDGLRANQPNHQNPAEIHVLNTSDSTICQIFGSQHESWSSRYENRLWRSSRTQIMPVRRAMECEDGLRQPREQRCDSTVRQPVKVKRRDFDAGGGGCHRPARLRRKRGHPSYGAALAEVFTVEGCVGKKTTHEPP